MFKWLARLFQSQPDEKEKRLKEIFSFLLNNHNFHFAKGDLGNAVSKEGEFLFYGPLNAFYFYNDNVCINILYLVQRQDYDIYITDTYKNDQIYIRNGTKVPDDLAYDLDRFAAEIRSASMTSGEIYGRKI